MGICVTKHKPKVRISVENRLFCLMIFRIFDPQTYLPLINDLRSAVSLNFDICVSPLTRFVPKRAFAAMQAISDTTPILYLQDAHTIRESREQTPPIWQPSATPAQPAPAATATKSACAHDRH